MKENESINILYTANYHELVIQFESERCITYNGAIERKGWKEDFSMKVPSLEFHREFIRYLKENGAFATLLGIVLLKGKHRTKWSKTFANDCLLENEYCTLVALFPNFNLPPLSINDFVMILKNKTNKN